MDEFWSSEDSSATLYTCSDETLVASSLHDNEKVLIFDPTDGSCRIDTRHDEYSFTSSNVVSEIRSFGIVGYIDLNFAKYIFIITQRQLVCRIRSKPVYRILGGDMLKISKRFYTTLDEDDQERATYSSVLHMLGSGLLYYSPDWDLTTSTQRTATERRKFPVDCDRRFFFNQFLLKPLLAHQAYDFVVPFICGFVGSKTLSVAGASGLVDVIVISRISPQRAGTRTTRRGINVNGYAAIFCETETIVENEGLLSSWVQIRGSVPLLWKQSGLQSELKLETSDAMTRVSLESMRKHFDQLLSVYGDGDITVIDIPDQYPELGDLYSKALWSAMWEFGRDEVKYVKHKFGDMERLKDLRVEMRRVLDKQSIFVMQNMENGLILQTQRGVVRTSDLDCVDETNVVQFALAKDVLVKQLKAIGVLPESVVNPELDESTLTKMGCLWADMGDAISKQYTGTCARYGHLTRRGRYSQFISPLSHLKIVLSRHYLNFVVDASRQDDLDFFIGATQLSNAEENVKFQCYVRRRLNLKDFNHKWYISGLLFAKKFLAPRRIDTVVDFIHAMAWLFIVMVYIKIFKVSPSTIIRRPRCALNLNVNGDVVPTNPHHTEMMSHHHVRSNSESLLNSNFALNFASSSGGMLPVNRRASLRSLKQQDPVGRHKSLRAKSTSVLSEVNRRRALSVLTYK